MERKINNPAKNHMEDRTLFVIVPLLATTLALVAWIFGYLHIQPTGILAYLVATLLTLTFIGYIVIFGLYLAEEKDEFERAMWIQSMLWGIGVTMAVTTFWGTMELCDVVHHLNPVWSFILFVSSMGIARRLLKWRYK